MQLQYMPGKLENNKELPIWNYSGLLMVKIFSLQLRLKTHLKSRYMNENLDKSDIVHRVLTEF